MPTSSRRTRLSVIERLIANPQEFSFTQVIRLLERASVFAHWEYQYQQKQAGKNFAAYTFAEQPIARFAPPTKEIIRFNTNQSLSFPETEFQSIKFINNQQNLQQWQVLVNFLGLTGAMGVMPFHYSELILQRLKQKDTSMRQFLDLFNHRSVSLFFQASNKYRLPIAYERSKLLKNSDTNDNSHTQSLLSLLGLGTKHLQNRQHIRDESLIFFSGLFSNQIKSPAALGQIIQHYFSVPVRVQGFIGQWQELIDDVRSRLGAKTNRKGQNVCLGRNSMLGRRGWFAQGKSRINIGPLNKAQFDLFAPGTGSLRALNELVQSYLGMEQDYDFVIEVKREDVPDKIALVRKNPPLLAWNTWLAGKPNTNSDDDNLLKIVVSSKKLQ